MNSKKRILFMIIIIIITPLIGCENNTTDKIYNNDSKIASLSDDFLLDSDTETVESGIYKGKFKLSGSKTIWTYESSSDFDLKVPYKLSLKSGKAKIILITPDNRVINLVENTNKSPVNESALLIIPIKKGNNRIKLVGYKKADINIELQIKEGNFIARSGI